MIPQLAHMTKRASKLVPGLLWLPALAVGALQMKDIQAGVITDYGADFFGPIALYASFRTHGWVPFLKRAPSPSASAAIVLIGCVLRELSQLYDFKGTPLAITVGSFDPWDIAAYILGVALAFATEKLVRHGRAA